MNRFHWTNRQKIWRHLKFWLLGFLTLLFCIAGQPAIALLSAPKTLAEAEVSINVTSLTADQFTFSRIPASSEVTNPTAMAQRVDRDEQQAQAAYARGQYQTAIAQLQQVQQQSRQQGDRTGEAVAWSNLSLSHQQLGNWANAETALEEAWSVLEGESLSPAVQAQVLDVQGQLQFTQGALEPALTTWQQSEAIYEQLGDRPKQVLSRLHQVQALQAQGRFQQVSRRFNALSEIMAAEPDSLLKAKLFKQLGDSLQRTGRFDAAESQLKTGSAIAQRLEGSALEKSALISAIHLSLGNLEQRRLNASTERGDRAAALDHAQASLAFYQQAVALEKAGGLGDGELGVQARLNVMQLLAQPEVGQWEQAIAFYPSIRSRLLNLAPGRSAIYGYTELVQGLIVIKQQTVQAGLRTGPAWTEIAELLASAHRQAKVLGDVRAQSTVLGTLAFVYEQTGQWASAEKLSRQALALAQTIQARDISYRWQWQLGRVLKAQGQGEQAIAAYLKTLSALDKVRGDLITANADVRFSFQDSIEPIYREAVSQLLASVPETVAQAQQKSSLKQNAKSSQAQRRLYQAREIMEALQVAQLEHFLQTACVEQATTVKLDQVLDQADSKAAALYTIALDDRLEVLLKLPQQKELVHYSAPVSRRGLEPLLDYYRAGLISGADVEAESRQLYDWLLRPAVDQGLLPPEQIETLLFSLGGELRLIPMATLHDGENYLIENYALDLTLGLDLRDPQTLPPRQQLQVLAASLTVPAGGDAQLYAPLSNANVELNRIERTGLPATLLRDEEFTTQTLTQQLEAIDYNVVHLATHGQFGYGREGTFVLSADGRIDIDDLGEAFQSSRRGDRNLELLILSACKTATGDSREVFGIAGAAIRAGAQSSMATLWSVDDEASVRFTQTLYENLGRAEVSRAEALRQAQLDLMQRYPGRPRYWAPYVLAGSWR